MVNVNTQVSSSMELPFGEYTSFVFINSAQCFQGGKRRSWSAAAAWCFLFCSAAVSSAGSQLIHSEKDHRHLCLAVLTWL